MVLDIRAWNYPLLTAVNAVVPAVLAGNAVVVKHSPRTPLCGEHFARAFAEAGAPPKASCTAVRATTRPASGSSARRAESTTSSSPARSTAGTAIQAARSASSTSASSSAATIPAYVAADGDLEKAVENVVDGAIYNAGQSCCASSASTCTVAVRPLRRGGRAARAAYVLGDPSDDEDHARARWHSRGTRRSSRRSSRRPRRRARSSSPVPAAADAGRTARALLRAARCSRRPPSRS